jgi:hypothetical protein
LHQKTGIDNSSDYDSRIFDDSFYALQRARTSARRALNRYLEKWHDSLDDITRYVSIETMRKELTQAYSEIELELSEIEAATG